MAPSYSRAATAFRLASTRQRDSKVSLTSLSLCLDSDDVVLRGVGIIDRCLNTRPDTPIVVLQRVRSNVIHAVPLGSFVYCVIRGFVSTQIIRSECRYL